MSVRCGTTAAPRRPASTGTLDLPEPVGRRHRRAGHLRRRSPSAATARTPAIASRLSASPALLPGPPRARCAGRAAVQRRRAATRPASRSPSGTRDATTRSGPDGYGYYAFDNTDTAYPDAPIYNWIEIDPTYGGSGHRGRPRRLRRRTRTSRSVVDLPFPFKFYGQTFTRATICSNGWIAMGSTYLTDYRNWTIPGAGGPADHDRRLLGRPLPVRHGQGLPVVRRGQPPLDRGVEPADATTYGGATETFEIDPLRSGLLPDRHRRRGHRLPVRHLRNSDGTEHYCTVGIQNGRTPTA